MGYDIAVRVYARAARVRARLVKMLGGLRTVQGVAAAPSNSARTALSRRSLFFTWSRKAVAAVETQPLGERGASPLAPAPPTGALARQRVPSPHR